MSLSYEESKFLEKLRKTRPDLIQALKREHYVEWMTRNRTKILAGLETIPQSKISEDEKTDIEKAVATRAKRIAMIS